MFIFVNRWLSNVMAWAVQNTPKPQPPKPYRNKVRQDVRVCGPCCKHLRGASDSGVARDLNRFCTCKSKFEKKF